MAGSLLWVESIQPPVIVDGRVMRAVFLVLIFSVMSLSADPRTEAFIREHLPSLARNLAFLKEAGEEEHRDELVDEARELREEHGELLREEGKKKAKAFLVVHDSFAAIDAVIWQFEHEELERDVLTKSLRDLFGKVFVHERILEEEPPFEREELARHVDEELRELLADLFEEEEEFEEIPADTPIYTPPPGNVPDPNEELSAVAFDFEKDIKVHLEFYCFECHDQATAKGDLDLESALEQTPLVRNKLLWENVAERVRGGDMPPKKVKDQPGDKERLQIRAWVHREVGQFDYSKHRNPGYLPVRRLTREEYNRTTRDLLGLDLRPSDDFPQDFSGSSGFSNSANTLYLQTAQLDRYITAADHLIDQVRANPEAWKKLSAGPQALDRFLLRAYRRPPSEQERNDAHARLKVALEEKKSPEEALAEALKFVLISPSFLLRVEESAEPGKDTTVTPYDLASRLSYFLWASMPDDELLEAASKNELISSQHRLAQVERLLADSRSVAMGEIFAGEWLGTNKLGPRIRKDPIDNPWCTESLMKAMRDETSLVFHHALINNLPIEKLLTDDHTFLNEELARFYKIAGVSGQEMRRVKLETDRRGGLLGHAAVLAVTSYPDRTSPVLRGTWILDVLLGTPPPPPPPDVPEIEVDGDGRRAARDLRENLERHRENPSCASCHDRIDPLGFALESYANFGQFRGGVDDRGSLPNGAKFRGAQGLKLALVDTRLDQFAQQIIRKMLSYGLSRQLEFYDEAVVRDIATKLKPKGYPLRDILVAITASEPFLKKRIPTKSGN